MPKNKTSSILTLTNRPLAVQIQTIERGFPSNALAEIAAILGLPKPRIIEGLKLVVRTITQREKKHERFSPMESERLYRVVRVRALAREIFSADATVAQWMSFPAGRSVRVPTIGPIQIDYEDRSCKTEAYVMGDECLLGCVPVECMDLAVDPVKERLVGRHPDGKSSRAPT